MNEPPQTRPAETRGSVFVIVADSGDPALTEECLRSVRAHTAAHTVTLTVPASAAAVNRALERVAPADAVLISEQCRVSPGWLTRLRDAACADSNTATASALADEGTQLALSLTAGSQEEFAALAEGLARRTLQLRPRLRRAVGPCVYVRRQALELVGPLAEELDLRSAIEFDFAHRCLLSGLDHVAADDVVVQRLAPARDVPPGPDSERPALAESGVLGLALAAARGPEERLWVTLDARALDGAVTGTQVHIVQLILALAHTGQLRLRLLVRRERIDHDTQEMLSGLPGAEVIAAEDLHASTPRSTVFHRPQQTFSAGDVALALSLGERFVISQLDLIAYRNPGYFADLDAWGDYRRASRHGLSAAERVVVFSDHTRRELISDALVADERVKVVPPGLDHRVAGEQHRPSDLDYGREAPADGFMLCLGTDFRHKNRVFALRMLASLRHEHDWRGSLVLAGTHIPLGSSLEDEHGFLAAHRELRDAVVALGPVSEPERAWLMAHAGAVIYPSVYEGFGLIPFESALVGVPCVFAAQSSLAKTAPEGTATIVPWDPQASAAGAYALLTDPAARTRHLDALATAARRLTWKATAGALVEIYREAAAAPVREAATLSRDAVERERRLSVEHDLEATRLVREREHAQHMYDELNAEVGSGLSLIGPHGALPEDLQHALLALGAHPALSRSLFGALARAFALARALRHLAGGRSR
jgi:glycosyltransferase involved in cell wall biosynthesis